MFSYITGHYVSDEQIFTSVGYINRQNLSHLKQEKSVCRRRKRKRVTVCMDFGLQASSAYSSSRMLSVSGELKRAVLNNSFFTKIKADSHFLGGHSMSQFYEIIESSNISFNFCICQMLVP